MNNPNPGSLPPASGAGSALDLLQQIQDFMNQLNQLQTMAAAVQIAHSLPEVCRRQRGSMPEDCGCCIMTMHYVLQNPGGRSRGAFFGLFGGGGTIAPSGNPIAITLAHAIYVPKPCNRTAPDIDYPTWMYDWATTVERRSKFTM